jgi:hypothetical protein
VLGATSVPAILLVAQLTNLARRSGNGALPGTRPDPTGITREVKSRSCQTPLQVPGDGLRPGVQPLPGQLFPQPGDQFHRVREIADGEVFGRRDRGSNAASPSALHHADVLTLTGGSCRTRKRRELLAKDRRVSRN